VSWRELGLHRASPFLRDFPSSFASLQRAACEQAAFLFFFFTDSLHQPVTTGLFAASNRRSRTNNLTVIIMTTKINHLSKDMDKKKLESFKKRLEERQQILRKTVSRTEEDGRIADQDTAQDIADRAASSYTKEFLFSQSNNDRQLLAMVETALQRIREGEFGECVNCGNEINPKRLEAVPWTRYCIACQEKVENGQLEEVEE